MPRRPNNAKHPALMVQEHAPTKAVITGTGPQPPEFIPGWSHFTATQREFLILLSWCGTLRDTCHYLGIPEKTYDRWGQRNGKFQAAYQLVGRDRTRIVSEYYQDMLGMSAMWLHQWLDPQKEVSDTLRKYAIDKLYQLTSPTREAAAPTSVTNIQAETVMFEGARSTKPEATEMAVEPEADA